MPLSPASASPAWPSGALDAPALARLADPARVAALRALCLHEGAADAAFDRLTRMAAHVLGAPAAFVNVIEMDRQVTRSVYGRGAGFQRDDVLPLPDSFCKFTVLAGEPLIVDETHGHPLVGQSSCVTGAGVRAYAGVPLALGSGHALGTLCVIDFVPRRWTAEEIGFLTDLAAFAATELELRAAAAVARDRLRSEAAARRLEAVHAVTDAALAQPTVDGTLDAMLGRLREVLAVDTATVLLLSEDGRELRTRASVGLDPEVERGVTIPVGAGIAGRVAATREPVIVRDVRAAGAASPALRERVRSLLAAPLVVGDRVVGVIHAGSFASREFEEDELRLLQVVADRVAGAIDRARLFEAERAARLLAEEASRAKTQFLAAVSHELRTPMNAISGYTQLLESGAPGALSEAQARIVSRMARSEEHLLSLIDDLIQLADGEQEVDDTAGAGTLLEPVLVALDASARPRAEARGLSYVRAPAPPTVIAMSASRCRAILERLIANAVKFTPPGGRVTIECERAAGTVAIRVRDTGPGIPEDRHEEIFDSFVQVDSSYHRAHGGLGLGLALARSLARAAGAEVTVESAPGHGSTFTLVAPLARR